MIIGKKGQEVDKLTKELEDLCHRHIEVKTMEVNRPEIDPQLVAEDIAEQLAEAVQLPPHDEAGDRTDDGGGAKGIKHPAGGPAGRGGNGPDARRAWPGASRSRRCERKVEYGFAEAKTAQGNIGIKVWINNGDYLTPEEDSDAANAQASKVQKKPARQGKR